MSKFNGFSVFNLAKKLQGLSAAEKTVATRLSDYIRRADGHCSASLTKITQDHGGSERQLQYGLHGRKGNQHREPFPGVLARGLFYIAAEHENPGKAGGRGKATTYKPKLENWYSFLPEEYHRWLDSLLGKKTPGKGEPKGEPENPERVNQNQEKGEPETDKGCTNAPESLKRIPKEETPLPPQEKKVEGAVVYFLSQYKNVRSGAVPIPPTEGEREQIQALEDTHGKKMFGKVTRRCFEDRGLDGLNRPSLFFVREFENIVAEIQREQAEQDEEQKLKNYMDEQAKKRQAESEEERRQKAELGKHEEENRYAI